MREKYPNASLGRPLPNQDAPNTYWAAAPTAIRTSATTATPVFRHPLPPTPAARPPAEVVSEGSAGEGVPTIPAAGVSPAVEGGGVKSVPSHENVTVPPSTGFEPHSSHSTTLQVARLDISAGWSAQLRVWWDRQWTVERGRTIASEGRS